MTRHYRLVLAAGFTVTAFATFAGLEVFSHFAAVPLSPPPTLTELGWVFG